MAQAQQTDKDAASADKSGNEAGDPKSRDQKSRPSARADEGEASQVNEVEQDPIAMLRSDHRKVEELFSSFDKAAPPQEKARLTEQICSELMIHTLLEEELFYPACKGHMEERLLAEAQVEHDGAKMLIIELQSGSPDDPYYDAKVKVLSEDIKHHVAEEEKPSSGIFAKAKQANVTTTDLAKQMGDRKRELTEKAKAGGLDSPEARSFRVRTISGQASFRRRTLWQDTPHLRWTVTTGAGLSAMTMMIDAHRGRAMTIMTTDATTARATRKAGLPIRGRDRAMTMTTGAAAATMAAGLAIAPGTRRLLVGAGRSVKAPSAVAIAMTTGVARGHAMTIMRTDVTIARATRKAGLPARGRDRAMTMTIGAAAAAMAAGSVTPKVMRKLLGTGAVSLRF